MSSPLEALEQRWLQECGHLGLPGARRGLVPEKLPDGEVAEINPRTKDKRGIGLLIDGRPHLIASPISWPWMRVIAMKYVMAGGHPADLLVWDYDPVNDAITATRTALDHLLWTASDQIKLEESPEK